MTIYCQDCGRQINSARGCTWCAIGKDMPYTCKHCGKSFPVGTYHSCTTQIRFATYQEGYDACKKEYETVILPARIAEAVKAERERVIAKAEKILFDGRYDDTVRMLKNDINWQQLKQEK